MQINTMIISKLKPCAERYENYLGHYKDFDGTLAEFIALDKITYEDKVWVFTKLATPSQNAAWAKLCADSVKHLANYANAADADAAAANAADAATRYADAAAATRYADAADAAAAATRYAADAARYAAAAARYAAEADDVARHAAARYAAADQESKNLSFMLEVI